MIEGCVNEARMAQWEEMGELCIEEEDIEEPCTEEDEMEELYATSDPIGEEPSPKMTRNKSIAKKPAPKVPQVRGSGTLRFNSAEQRERYQAYMQKPVVPPYVINLDTLEEFGIREEVEALLGEKEWKYILVDFEDAIYPDLVLELLDLGAVNVGANLERNMDPTLAGEAHRTAELHWVSTPRRRFGAGASCSPVRRGLEAGHQRCQPATTGSGHLPAVHYVAHTWVQGRVHLPARDHGASTRDGGHRRHRAKEHQESEVLFSGGDDHYCLDF
nr:hypothetical protein Iba_chr10fCG11570 [Ipomoea batatas]